MYVLQSLFEYCMFSSVLTYYTVLSPFHNSAVDKNVSCNVLCCEFCMFPGNLKKMGNFICKCLFQLKKYRSPWAVIQQTLKGINLLFVCVTYISSVSVMDALFGWSNRLPRETLRKTEMFLIIVRGKQNLLVTNGT